MQYQCIILFNCRTDYENRNKPMKKQPAAAEVAVAM